jgi:hypothetical protein
MMTLMRRRRGTLVLILLIPLALYGLAKGVLYYQAKQVVDDIVDAASGHAEVTYGSIATDLTGGVTVDAINITPHGSDKGVTVASIRVRSDDPLFLFRGGSGASDEPPPGHLAVDVSDIAVPLDAGLLAYAEDTAGSADADAAGLACEQGLNLSPNQLQQIGFERLNMDVSAYYRLDDDEAELVAGFDLALRDMQSMRADVTLEDVDVAAFESGAPPQVSLGDLSLAIDVDPAFGRQILKFCAVGSDRSVDEWGMLVAEQTLRDFEAQGLRLGEGLAQAVRRFHRDWGTFSIEARPAKPVGVLSLMFLPPDQLASLLGLQMRLNGEPIADTRFEFERPDVSAPGGLAAIFGAEPPDELADSQMKRPARIIVQRRFETVAVADIRRYVGRKVRITPRSQPVREGMLKGIQDNEAEVEQRVLGGKFTAYVPLDEIEALQALVERRVDQP